VLLQTAKSSIVSEGVLEAKKFDIQFNAKMASILSDGLYSYKVRAIIRELSTNAVDAQKAAGNKQKFDVNLPSYNNCNFIIRDYGTGLSKQQVIDIFSVYGASNKENSNDYVGCLGLGSKSPFSYNTRTFTVESFYNGIHLLYNCYRDEEGMPAIALQYEGKTTEPNGLKIKIPVAYNDIFEFAREAKYVYRDFDVKPNIVGQQIDVSSPDYQLKGEGWGYDSHYDHAHVIMGNVRYPVSINLPGCEGILQNGFDIIANIGDVDIQPSREGLSYNPQTKSFLITRCKEILENLTKLVNTKISGAKTLWDACLAFNDLSDIVPNELHDCINLDEITFNGKPLPVNHLGRVNIKDYFDVANPSEYVRRMYRDNGRCRQEDSTEIVPSSKATFVINDMKLGAISRSKDLVATSGKTVYLFSIAKINDFISDFGIDSSAIIKASSLPEPVKTARTGNRQKLSQIVRLKLDGLERRKSYCWENVNIDEDDGGVFIPFTHYDLLDASGTVRHPDWLCGLLRELKKLNIALPTVYGIKIKDIDELPDGWESFWVYIQRKLEEIKLENNYSQCIHFQDELSHRSYPYYGNQSNTYEHGWDSLNYLDGDLFASLKEKIKLAQKGVKELDTINSLRYISDNYGVTIDTAGKVEKLGLKDTVKLINKRYPLLAHIPNVRSVEVQKYVDLMEKSYAVSK